MVYSVIGSLAVVGVLAFSGFSPSGSLTVSENSNHKVFGVNSTSSVTPSPVSEVYEYKGKKISSLELIELNSKGLALQTVYSTENGLSLITAFDSLEESDIYLADIAQNKRSLAPSLMAKKSVTEVSQDNSMISPMGTVGGCPGVSYGSRDYVDGGCGGSYLAFSPNDSVAYFGTFGMNDMMSSYTIAPASTSACLITKRYYNNANYDVSGGTWTVMGEFNAYTSGNFSSVQNDKVSSEKSFCS